MVVSGLQSVLLVWPGCPSEVASPLKLGELLTSAGRGGYPGSEFPGPIGVPLALPGAPTAPKAAEAARLYWLPFRPRKEDVLSVEGAAGW